MLGLVLMIDLFQSLCRMVYYSKTSGGGQTVGIRVNKYSLRMDWRLKVGPVCPYIVSRYMITNLLVILITK